MPKLTLITNEQPNAKQRVRNALRGNKADIQCSCGSRSYTFIYTGTTKQRVCVFCLLDKRIVEI